MAFSVWGLLTDIAFASVLLLVGQLLRSKIKLLQEFFLPASLIAGLLGFICGPSNLNWIPFSNQLSSYAGMLIVLVFVELGVQGFKISSSGLKGEVQRLGGYWCFKEINAALQYTVPFFFTIFVLGIFFETLHPAFGLLIAMGWLGGPGTAAGMSSVLASYGWTDAPDLGMTAATCGLLAGIIGGVILIKIGARKGYTSYISDYASLPEELRTALMPEEKRVSMGSETVSNVSIDPLALHLAFVLVPAGIGYLLTTYIRKNFGLDLPTFSVAFLVAVALSFPLKRLGVQKYMDNRVFGRISGTATDYLVFFGVSSIKMAVVIKYAAPLAILMVFAVVLVTVGVLYLGPKLNKKDWFERSLFCYGYLTGVYANAFLLARIVDPDNKSKTLEDTAIIAPVTSWVDILCISLAPILVCTGKVWWLVGGMGAYMAFYLILATAMKWWNILPLARREMIEEDQ